MKAAASTALIELGSKVTRLPRDRKRATEIKEGSIVVKIFGAAPGPWTIAWYEHAGGPRHKTMRATFPRAKRFAQEKAIALANGESAATMLSPADTASYMRALENLRPVGVNLELATAEYASCAKKLDSVSLTEAVNYFLENRPVGLTNKTIPQIIPEFLARKKEDGIGVRWYGTLEDQLEPFGKHFNCPFHIIKAAQIDSWLRSLGQSARSRVNYRTAVRGLVTFAKSLGYLPRSWDEMDRVAVPHVKPVQIKILTPEQLSRLFACCPQSIIPFVALTAFAGIRHEEMNGYKANLEWSDIHFDEKVIYVPAAVGKTGESDRLVPMSDNLIAWLTPHARRSGYVCNISTPSNTLTRAKKKAGIPAGKNETRNTLRKSFISYRLTLTKNIAQVAEEAGNSPSKIKSNYRRPIPDAEAKRWFGVWPTNAEVIQLQFAIK